MLRTLSLNQRVWVFLMALLILGGMSLADTFDLTDDIPLSQDITGQALLSEEIREEILWMLALSALAHSFSAPAAPNIQTVQVPGHLPLPLQTGLQLYQRVSTYRI